MSKKKHRKKPRLPDGADLIMKLGYMIDGTERDYYAVMEVVLVANELGFTYLSKLLAYMAHKARYVEEGVDYHEHIGKRSYSPFNKYLSDDIEIRLEVLPPKGNKEDRELLFKQHGISRSLQRKGDMIPHLRLLAKEASRSVRQEKGVARSPSPRGKRRKS